MVDTSTDRLAAPRSDPPSRWRACFSLGACGGGGGAPAGSPLRWRGTSPRSWCCRLRPSSIRAWPTTLTITGGDAAPHTVLQQRCVDPSSPAQLDRRTSVALLATCGQRGHRGDAHGPAMRPASPSTVTCDRQAVAAAPGVDHDHRQSGLCGLGMRTLCSGQDGTATVVVTGVGRRDRSPAGRSAIRRRARAPSRSIAANSTAAGADGHGADGPERPRRGQRCASPSTPRRSSRRCARPT